MKRQRSLWNRKNLQSKNAGLNFWSTICLWPWAGHRTSWKLRCLFCNTGIFTGMEGSSESWNVTALLNGKALHQNVVVSSCVLGINELSSPNETNFLVLFITAHMNVVTLINMKRETIYGNSGSSLCCYQALSPHFKPLLPNSEFSERAEEFGAGGGMKRQEKRDIVLQLVPNSTLSQTWIVCVCVVGRGTWGE